MIDINIWGAKVQFIKFRRTWKWGDTPNIVYIEHILFDIILFFIPLFSFVKDYSEQNHSFLHKFAASCPRRSMDVQPLLPHPPPPQLVKVFSCKFFKRCYINAQVHWHGMFKKLWFGCWNSPFNLAAWF